MRNSIYSFALVSFIALSSCSTIMNNLPGVYSLDVQQGNIINQDMIDQLRPGMTKRQVLYIMGSSMLVDVFHQQRWDYLYSTQPGGESRKQKRLSLFFDGDSLIGVQGDFRPSTLAVIRKSNETTLDLPKRDLDNTLWGKMSRLMNENEATPPTKPSEATEIKSIEDSKVNGDSALEKQTIDSQTVKFIEKTGESEQDISNKKISITPLQEKVQIIEQVLDDNNPPLSEESTAMEEFQEINDSSVPTETEVLLETETSTQAESSEVIENIAEPTN
jgi:outer membrane protein assembly factor BamE